MKQRFLYFILPVLLITSCLKDERFKTEYTGFEPGDCGDEWMISTPEQESMNWELIDQAYRLLYSDQRFLMARSLLVIRNGKLVAEAYPHDRTDRGQYANIQSCTKSFTSILLGIALQHGVDVALGEKLFDIYPELFDDDIRKQSVTIEDALTMQTGLEFDNDRHTLRLYQTTENSAQFVLSLPFVNEPGTVMNYNDGAPHLISKVIEVKTGKVLSEYAEVKLFTPLGITDWKWEHAKDGTTFGAFSLFLKPRDFAKVGQLLLQNGNWNGYQIISQEYLSDAIAHQVTNDRGMPYGYYFWIDENHDGYYAHGHGGQVLLVVPSLNLVLLYTAWPYTSGEFFDDAFDLFDLIILGCE
jgi:CubicO group peptidase (beta-lactamase class C family)